MQPLLERKALAITHDGHVSIGMIVIVSTTCADIMHIVQRRVERYRAHLMVVNRPVRQGIKRTDVVVIISQHRRPLSDERLAPRDDRTALTIAVLARLTVAVIRARR